jgi:UDP-glucose 4-epimerase
MVRDNVYVFVTGASGLIGNELCKLLDKNGIKFIAADRSQPFPAGNWETRVIDLTQGLGDTLPKIDTVFHCAARIPTSPEEFRECSDLNQQIDSVVANFIVERGVEKLVFASTTNLYGTSSEPVSEESEVYIQNEYALGKLNSERMFAAVSSVSTFILRLNAPYGPLQKHETVLSRFIRRAQANLDLAYHGTGSRCQDFTHVSDVARAFLKCFESDGSGGTFNISSGSPISMKELAELVVSLIPGSTSEIRPSNQPDPQEHHRAIFDGTKARNELGWSPSISLREGISDWIAKIG